MGFFKSLFSDTALAESTIASIEKSYWKTRKQRKNEDEHIYLATALLRRIKNQMRLGQNPLGAPRGEMLDNFVLTQTQYFSVLDPPESIRALALFVVSKEIPGEAHNYELEFAELIKPIIKMEENGTFEDIYIKKNPNITNNG